MATANILRKLRVVNLPWTVGDVQLKQYFSQFGNIVNARVFFDRSTGLSKCTGIVEINDKNTYEAVLKRNHHLEGLELYIKNWNDQ